jgi:hypothetical protein
MVAVGVGRCCCCWSWSVLFLLLLLAVSFADLLSGLDGRRITQGFEGAARGWLVSVPLSERGAWWSAAEFTTKLCLTSPLFAAAGGRAPFFDTLFEVNGETAPFERGIAHSSYRVVSAALAEVEQPGQPFMAGTAVTPRCLGNNTLLFVGSSQAHVRMRSFLADQLQQEYSHGGRLLQAAGSVDSADAVRRTVIRELFRNMWGTLPPPQAEDGMLEYLTWGSMCFVGEGMDVINTVTGGHALRTLDRIRSDVVSAAAKTPRGKSLLEAAEAEFGEADGVLAAAVDGMLFAGIRGTVHLVEAIVERIEGSHASMVALWTADRRSFVLEQARLDPPVLTSVSSIVTKFSAITMGAGRFGERTVNMEPGSVTQLVLSQANRDPDMFGGALHLPSRAHEFDPTRGPELDQVLTFNNVLNSRAGEATGPGYGLTMELTVALVDCFLPSIKPQQQAGVPVEESQILGVLNHTRNRSADTISRWLRVSGIANHVELYADIFRRESLFDDVGTVAWAFCCLYGVYSISKGPNSRPPTELVLRLGAEEAEGAWRKRPALVGRHYEFYLLAQFGVALGMLLRHDLLQSTMKVGAAASYAALALRVDEFFKHRDAWHLVHSQSVADIVDRTRASPRPAVATSRARWQQMGNTVRSKYAKKHFTYEYAPRQPGYLCIARMMLLLGVILILGHIYAPNSFEGRQSMAIYAAYTPACLAAWLSIFRFMWRCKDQSGTKARTWRLGVIGGFFGIVNLIWPLLFPPYLYHFLSRTADSILYVPLVLAAVSQMDDELWAAVPWTEARDDRLAKGLRLGSKPVMWLTFAAVLGCQSWETWSPFVSEVMHSCGSATPLKLCHNPVDEAAHPAACAAGTAYLRAADGHTRVVFGLFQALDFAEMDDLAPSVVTPSTYFGSISAHKPHTVLLPDSGFDVTIPSFDVSDDAELKYCDRRYMSCDSTGEILGASAHLSAAACLGIADCTAY